MNRGKSSTCLPALILLLIAFLIPAAGAAELTRAALEAATEASYWNFSEGQWQTGGGMLVQSNTRLFCAAFLKNPACRNACVSAEFRVSEEGTGVKAAGLLIGATSDNDYIGLHLETRTPQLILYRTPWVAGGTEMGRRALPRERLAAGQWHSASLEARGTKCVVHLDGRKIFEVEMKAESPVGLPGVYTSQGKVEFRNITVHGNAEQMKEEWKMDPKLYKIICDDAGAGGYQAFPDVCRAANGDLIAVYYAGYGHVSVANDRLPKAGRICASRSTDDGRSWGAPFMVCDTDADDRDPHIALLPDGSLICNWFATWPDNAIPAQFKFKHQVVTSVSGDNGRTWSEPQWFQFAEDLWWVCSAPVRVLSDKTLILGLYTEDAKANTAYGATVKSRDGGKTWTNLATIGKDSGVRLDAETDVIELKDGRLFAALRSPGPSMYYAFSADKGLNWGPVKPFGFPGHCPYLMRHSSGAILCAHRLPATSVTWSWDEGATWAKPIQVDSVGGAYPSLLELKDGTILCVYYEEGENSRIRAARLRATREKGAEAIPW
ncbi:MAG TPA: exo-alpha-sialidase [Candidatus Brocadiia bacterium]|nr:exo-alpha-sialidase [Candidatus Brocadiia bacterium]